MKLVRSLLRRIRVLLALRSARRDTDRVLQQVVRPRRVLVVCYGNIYRSPFAATLLRSLMPSVEVSSGGFHRRPDRTSPAAHIEMCRRRGVMLDAHRSRVLDRAAVDEADLIVLMDRHNWYALDALGASREKIVWLGALTSGDTEIADPYAMSEAQAEQILDRLEQATRALAGRLQL